MRIKALQLALAALLALLLAPAAAPGAEGPPKEPSLPSKKRKEVKALIKEYFKAGDPAARKPVLEKIAAFDPVPKSAVRDLVQTCFRYAFVGPRFDGKHKAALTTPAGTGSLLVSGVKKRKLQPLLIGLHGGGAGAGDGANSEQKWQAAVGKGCICIFPTVIQKTNSAWNTEREEKYVLAIVEQAKRSFRVDTNRIYLVGHSMGGYGTWSVGGHYADLFAALSPNAGGVFGQVSNGKLVGLARGVLPNLHNTPVYFFHSTDDPRVPATTDQMAAKILAQLGKEHPGGYAHVYKEYTDIGHGMPKDGVGPILKWVLAKKRDPYPTTVVFEPVRSYKRLFAWVELPLGCGISWICATYDKKANRIAVAAKGGSKGFRLYLNAAKMINPRKPVTVTVNGTEAFSGYVQRSAAAVVRSIGALRDTQRYFDAVIAVE